MIKPHLKYLRYVLTHKWYVIIAGRKLGLGWRQLLVHDYTKFSRAEWGPYVRRFYGGRGGIEDKSMDPAEFLQAFRHHWQRNPHHWEYWLTPSQTYQYPAFRIPEAYTLEMVADWFSVGKTKNGHWDITTWYEATKERRQLHPETFQLVESALRAYDFGRAMGK